MHCEGTLLIITTLAVHHEGSFSLSHPSFELRLVIPAVLIVSCSETLLVRWASKRDE
jgi:hypothetical protein